MKTEFFKGLLNGGGINEESDGLCFHDDIPCTVDTVPDISRW
jgi:hypothetical protein